MIRRVLMVFGWLFLGVMFTYAQRLGGGVILGPTFSTMSLSDIDSTRFRADYCFGVRVALIPEHFIFGGEVDVIYSRQGTRMKQGVLENGSKVHWMEKSSYINIPLLLNVYHRRWREDDEDETKMIRLRIGPQIGFCLKGDEVEYIKEKNRTIQHITPWALGSFNRIDYGLTMAISYWYVEIRYTYGVSNVFKEGEKSTNHVISVTWSDIW